MNRRPTALLAVLALALAALVGNVFAPPRSAEAQTTRPEMLATGHFDVSSIATIVTGSTGLQVNVTRIYVSSATAGFVTLHDGTTGGDATRVGLINFYLIANTPTEIPAGLLAKVKTATTGNSIKAIGPGVLTYAITYTN